MHSTKPPALRSYTVARNAAGTSVEHDDQLTVEEPLEIRVAAGGNEQIVTVTMRTPGDDAALAIGLLYSERVVRDAGDIADTRTCGVGGNVLRVELRPGVTPNMITTDRNIAATASCGLCGKASLDAVLATLDDATPVAGLPHVQSAILRSIPAKLRASQMQFQRTGGLHGVAAFDARGNLLAVKEDIGRHNALDKLLGAMLRPRGIGLEDSIVALSGRAGFELLQKAAVARVPLVAAIGAPSTLAVDVAERFGITLIGFLREDSFNIYAHGRRVGA
jgi:FdhD protein